MTAALNLRQTPRLDRVPNDYWQINVNHDELITRNIINLCPGGVSFKTPQRVKFEKGQWLHLQVWLSANSSFECEAKVVWANDQTYGLQFFKIPFVFDAHIMRAIHEANTDLKRTTSSEQDLKFASLVKEVQKRSAQENLISAGFSLLMIASMAAALVATAFIHQRNHPEQTAEYIFSQAFGKLKK